VSLTVANTLAQQQAIQSQIAAAQTSAPSTASTSDSTASTSSAASSNPAAALISGNATLTSDLLSVLLNEQSGISDTGSSGGSVTLAGLLDQQDQIDQSQGGQSSLLSDFTTGLTATSTSSSSATTQQSGTPNLISDLDAASLTQSATSTGSVMDGLQSLLSQLSA